MQINCPTEAVTHPRPKGRKGDINMWGDLLCSAFSHLCGPWKTIKRGGLLPGARHSSDSSGLMSEERGRRSGGIWTHCCVHGPHRGCEIWALLISVEKISIFSTSFLWSCFEMLSFYELASICNVCWYVILAKVINRKLQLLRLA